jgi:His-Xaa-Ser system protein HxsD
MATSNPTPLLSADLSQGSACLEVDAKVYPLDALYGAAYVFIDRCYVFLEKPAEDRFRVTLSPKKGDAAEAALTAMAGEFANELLSCAWRQKITEANRAQIESVTMQAIAGAMGPPSLDDLANFDFTDAPLEDPLGIAMSWEEKYKKKEKKAP